MRDASGRPVAGVMIVPRSLQATGPPIPELAVITDAYGRYAWELPPGPYELSAAADGWEPARQRGTVAPGVVTALDIVLRPGR